MLIKIKIKNMFLLSPDVDMQLMLSLMVVVFIGCFVYSFFAKEKIKVLLFFSILINLILFVFILMGTRAFHFYNIVWFRNFSFFVWPIINIYLITKIFSKK